jgi:hypothetical protein
MIVHLHRRHPPLTIGAVPGHLGDQIPSSAAPEIDMSRTTQLIAPPSQFRPSEGLKSAQA